MVIMSVSEAKIKLNKLVERVGEGAEEVTITRNGRPVAMLVNPRDYESYRETQASRDDPELTAEIRRGLRQLEGAGKGMSFEDVFGEP